MSRTDRRIFCARGRYVRLIVTCSASLKLEGQLLCSNFSIQLRILDGGLTRCGIPYHVTAGTPCSYVLSSQTPRGSGPQARTDMREQNPVVVKESSALEVSGGQTEGMQRANALVGLTPNICASRMIARPHTASAVHHHGEQDTVVFAFSGHGTIVSEGGNKRQNLSPGDYALIPWVYYVGYKVKSIFADICICMLQSIRRTSGSE